MLNTLPQSLSSLQQAVVPEHIFLPKGMIIPGEQTLLYLLARDTFDNEGAIIDAGAFCGASAYAFAAGLSDNPRVASPNKQIHSYDLFVVDDSYTRTYIQNGFYFYTGLGNELMFPKRHVEVGESFIEIFRFQTQRYTDFIAERAGSILEYRWDRTPISILFIDVAKSLALQQHVFAQFLPSLRVGGFLLQQDFHHAWHPYIHVAMEFLAPYFEITHSKIGATRAYRLTRPISPPDLQRVIRHDFSIQERRDLIARCVSGSPLDEQPLLQVVQARELLLCQDDSGVVNVAQDFANRWSTLAGFEWLAEQMRSAAGPSAANVLREAGF